MLGRTERKCVRSPSDLPTLPYNPVPSVTRQPQAAADFVDKILYRLDYFSGQAVEGAFAVRDYWTRDLAFYADSYAIYAHARDKGIPPELLVDEDYYYRRSGGLAPYRITFACHAKGLKMSELVAAADNVFGHKINIRSWKYFLEGYVNGYKVALEAASRRGARGVRFVPHRVYRKRPIQRSMVSVGYLIVVCEILEIPLASIFRTVRMGGVLLDSDTTCGRGIYGGIHKVISMLDDADLAVLVGIGLFLATKDPQAVRNGLDGLLKWWEGRNGKIAEAEQKRCAEP